MAKKIRTAVICQIARDNNIPYHAATFKYSCMSIKRKQALCQQEEKRREALSKKEASSRP